MKDKLNQLIEEIENKERAKGLSDSYLSEHGYMTRNDVGVGEYSYGIIMIPTDWVLPYLKELRDIYARR
jgi:hypothetical protein|nr:MAG TPA: hypothetical protein [Caudoviricetes sp.]